MGISNIHILTDPEPTPNHKMQDYIQARRVVEHRAGKHPDGQKRRDCPMCVAGK